MSTKAEVLTMLEKRRENFVSGQELAQQLCVSRTAVWKAIKSLQEDGHRIAAISNKGYLLSPDSDLLSQEGIATHLGGDGSSITVLKTVDSTNTYGKKFALAGAVHGSIIVSEEQTGGRGRNGKSFFSPRDTGLYMSLILRPSGTVRDPQMITIAAAVAVCRAIEGLTRLSPQIKWVNDLYLNGRKICGILTEAVTDFESGGIESIVVGIGVNCSTAAEAFPNEIRGLAGSLNFQGINRNQLAAEIARGTIQCFENLKNPTIIDEYRERSLMLGREISFQHQGETLRGTVTGINELGNLLVRCAEGTELVLSSGEVSLNWDASKI